MDMLSSTDFLAAVEEGLLPPRLRVTLDGFRIEHVDIDAPLLHLRRVSNFLPRVRVHTALAISASDDADQPPPKCVSVAIPWPAGPPDPNIEVQLVHVDLSAGCIAANEALLAADAEVAGRLEAVAASAAAATAGTNEQPFHIVADDNSNFTVTPPPTALPSDLTGGLAELVAERRSAAAISAAASSLGLDQSGTRTPHTAAGDSMTPRRSPGRTFDELPTVALVEAIDAHAEAAEAHVALARSLGLIHDFTLDLAGLARRRRRRANLGRPPSAPRRDPDKPAPGSAPDAVWWHGLCTVHAGVDVLHRGEPPRGMLRGTLSIVDAVQAWFDRVLEAAGVSVPQVLAELRRASGAFTSSPSNGVDDDALEALAKAMADLDVTVPLAVPMPMPGARCSAALHCTVSVRVGSTIEVPSRKCPPAAASVPRPRPSLAQVTTTPTRRPSTWGTRTAVPDDDDNGSPRSATSRPSSPSLAASSRTPSRPPSRGYVLATTPGEQSVGTPGRPRLLSDVTELPSADASRRLSRHSSVSAPSSPARLPISAQLQLERAVARAVDLATSAFEGSMVAVVARIEQLAARVDSLEATVASVRGDRSRVAAMTSAAMEGGRPRGTSATMLLPVLQP